MMARGVYLPPSQFEACFISLALEDEMIEETIKSVELSLLESL
jgi:glutamate-1-semialdehyde 2,1-aminomutase